MSTQWKTQKKYGSEFILKLSRWTALTIGRRFFRVALYPICLYYLICTPTSKQQAKKYLQKALNRPITWRDHFKHYHTFASVILDRVYFLTDNHQHFNIKVYGGDAIIELANQKQGAILLGAHLGSFDALRGLADTNKLPLKALMHVQSSESVTNLLHALNKNIANSIIPMGTPESILQMKDWLTQGGLIGILSDRVYQNDKVMKQLFLNDFVNFASGPFRLAQLFKVPIFFCCGLYVGKNRYEIYFEKINANSNIEVETLLERYIKILEKYTLKSPYNWFNFYDYWK